jgi:hypothetical protein
MIPTQPSTGTSDHFGLARLQQHIAETDQVNSLPQDQRSMVLLQSGCLFCVSAL